MDGREIVKLLDKDAVPGRLVGKHNSFARLFGGDRVVFIRAGSALKMEVDCGFTDQSLTVLLWDLVVREVRLTHPNIVVKTVSRGRATPSIGDDDIRYSDVNPRVRSDQAIPGFSSNLLVDLENAKVAPGREVRIVVEIIDGQIKGVVCNHSKAVDVVA